MVKPSGQPEKQRQLYRYSGLLDRNVIGVHNNSLANLRRGMVERMFYVVRDGELAAPPKPLPGQFSTIDQFTSMFKDMCGHHFPITREQFLLYYRGRKLTIYEKAVESLSVAPVTVRDARLKTFVKAEKLNLSNKPDPAPRIIQPRSPRYNVELGVFLRPFEHRAFDVVARIFGEPVIMKGYTHEQQAAIFRTKWDSFHHPVGIGLDASRFDQHVSEDALKWEHSLYNHAFKHNPKLKRLLKWQINNEGIAFASDGMIKYKKRGCRMSGDMNTSLGNCLLMCAMVHQFFRELNVNAKLMNNGDDCVIICERSDVVEIIKSIPEFFHKFGFTMEVEKPEDVFEKVEFCQTQPVYDGAKWIMVRKPRTAISKDLCCLLPLQSEDNYKEWLTAVSECGMALNGGIPVMQNFYSKLNLGAKRTGLTSQGEFLAGGLAYAARGMHRKFTPCTDEARVSFWKAFDITPDLQVALEAWYDDINLHIDSPVPCDTRQRNQHEIIDGVNGL